MVECARRQTAGCKVRGVTRPVAGISSQETRALFVLEDGVTWEPSECAQIKWASAPCAVEYCSGEQRKLGKRKKRKLLDSVNDDPFYTRPREPLGSRHAAITSSAEQDKSRCLHSSRTS
jgi:hypothetical protein